jgi:hypothetical protein
MTPKEKAISIIESMLFSINKQIDFETGNFIAISRNPFAKQCALIAVDEILSIQVVKNGYWQEVKAEIEKL